MRSDGADIIIVAQSDNFTVVAAWGQAENKVLRGGSFNNNPNNIRATNRNNNEPDNRNNNIGFRCVVSTPGSFLKGQVPCVP